MMCQYHYETKTLNIDVPGNGRPSGSTGFSCEQRFGFIQARGEIADPIDVRAAKAFGLGPHELAPARHIPGELAPHPQHIQRQDSKLRGASQARKRNWAL